MDRREFLRDIGVAAVGFTAQAAIAGDEKAVNVDDVRQPDTAAPCGLYCGVCPDYLSDVCHGCKCECGKCIGKDHAEICDIARCAKGRRLTSCAACKELPCSRLIQFTFDPVWRTHNQCIENLRRQKAIGNKAWLAEQEEFWRDEKKRQAWSWLGEECSRRADELRKSSKPG